MKRELIHKKRIKGERDKLDRKRKIKFREDEEKERMK